jgi:hypothetical protein
MEPKTRKEYYLAAIAGEDVTMPEPKTRQEHYLKEIAENGGGSGGGGVLDVVKSLETNLLDKTYAEIKSASDSGMVVRLKRPNGKEPGIYAWHYLAEIGSYVEDGETGFYVRFANPAEAPGSYYFEAYGENEYPVQS